MRVRKGHVHASQVMNSTSRWAFSNMARCSLGHWCSNRVHTHVAGNALIVATSARVVAQLHGADVYEVQGAQVLTSREASANK
jgi:nitrous oxidase accessory protein NosD